MATDVRSYVEECPVCQIEKADYTQTKGRLQNLQLLEQKWQEVELDFIFKLPPASSGYDGIMTVVDRATRMVYLAPCRESDTGKIVTNRYWATVGRLHSIPKVLYSDHDV